MLDVIVLIAMAVTAAAVAAGLVLQAGIALLPAAIAAAALFLVMAASYLLIARTSRAVATERLDELEEALEIIDTDLKRIDRVEDDLGRLDLLTDRVERLDQAVTHHGSDGMPGGHARIEELAAELQTMHARIEGLRSDLEMETRNQRDKITSDLGLLETLIKQLSRDLTRPTPAPGPDVVAPAAAAIPPEPPASEDSVPDTGSEDVTLLEEETTVETEAEQSPEPAEAAVAVEEAETEETSEDIEVVEGAKEEAAAVEAAEEIASDESDTGEGLLGTLRQAVERGRVDLYLQPIVVLPERKTRYYEGLTRIRTASDDVILPGAYLPVAESEGMMPLIDNVLLVKSVQVLRRRSPDSKVKALFCNISMQSLLDADFFPELVEFMEENSGLSENLVFEIRQPEIIGLTRSELGALDTLGALGFSFSLDHVGDLDVDFIGLSDRYFRFIKIGAPTFLYGMKDSGAGLPAADMKGYLEGFGLQLIVEKVEDEAQVAELIDMGVEYAQGNLFAAAKPVTPDLFRELEEADAA
jgi:cyclic-di-GMP phosphodiesterase TipF (flagellum assembly factor)